MSAHGKFISLKSGKGYDPSPEEADLITKGDQFARGVLATLTKKNGGEIHAHEAYGLVLAGIAACKANGMTDVDVASFALMACQAVDIIDASGLKETPEGGPAPAL